VRDVWLRTGLSPQVLERLADADAFSSLGLNRRDALWAAKALGRVGDRDDDLPLFRVDERRTRSKLFPPPLWGREGGNPQAQGSVATPTPTPHGGEEPAATSGDVPATHNISASYERMREPDVHLPPMPIGEEVVNDYRFLRLSLRAHPAQFLRADLAARRILRNEKLRATPSNTRVRISGLVTCRQRPGSANGVVFMTIEDETAIANVIIWPKLFERARPVVLGARYVAVEGPVQEEAGVIHVVAEKLVDLTALLARLAEGAAVESSTRRDDLKHGQSESYDRREFGGKRPPLEIRLPHLAELAADLDVPARGTAHAPTKRTR
jgi:error-prone DNA polymerase